MELERKLKQGVSNSEDEIFDKVTRCHKFDIVMIDAFVNDKETISSDEYFKIDEIIIFKINIYEN